MDTDKNLAAKLKEHLAKTGVVSSSDLATFAKAQIPEPEAPKGEEMVKTTELPTADPAAFDDIDAAAKTSPVQDGLRNEILSMSNSNTSLTAVRQQVKITPADKEAFIQAAITGQRMLTSFSTCGGRISMVLRNRTLPETRAIISQLRLELDDGTIATNLDYSVRLRSMLMAAQVEEFNGIAQPTLESCAPLRPTQGTDGLLPPGWLKHADRWGAINEGVHGIIWAAIWEFETKYWTMVDDAKNQDFWSPEAST